MTDVRADDPMSGRNPTSHERMTGLPWDASYRDGPAPWDIGRPQLATARAKADDRRVEVEFVAADALHLERLGRRFETVLDCGLFHTFDGDERPAYVASLASVTAHDATVYVLCFSDESLDTGPYPVSREELRAAFDPGTGWNVAAIEPDRIETRYHAKGAPAWLATVKRI